MYVSCVLVCLYSPLEEGKSQGNATFFLFLNYIIVINLLSNGHTTTTNHLKEWKAVASDPSYISPNDIPKHIRNVLLFVLKYNCFNFADLFFLQIRGVAMGTKMAPNYANLYMTNLEMEHIFNYPVQPTYYRRYLDDIILIWSATLEEFNTFKEHLNQVHPSIKFTFETSPTTLPYLDVNVHIEEGRAFVTPHFKKTNTFSYIRGDSYHPQSIYGAIVTGENTRILRNSSKKEGYEATMDMLKTKFKDRQFPKKVVDKNIIPFESRDEKLQGDRQASEREFVTMVCDFDRNLPMKKVLEENWGIFANDENTRKILLPRTPRVAYTLGTNIGRRITKAKLEGTIETDTNTHQPPSLPKILWPAKNIECRHRQCGMCKQLAPRSYFYSHQTKIRYPIETIYSCDTTGAIYLLDCTKCGKQYIGETGTSVRARMKRHRNTQKTAVDRPIYDHLKKHNATFEIFTITIIDQVKDMRARKAKEMEYIQLMKTKVPFGLNVLNKNKK